MQRSKRLAEEFSDIEDLCDENEVRVETLIAHLEGRSQALITFFLAGPFLLPLPLPGLSVPFGVLIALFGLAMATGRKPSLPKRWLKGRLSSANVKKFCGLVKRLLVRYESLLKPRWMWFTRRPSLITGSGVMIGLCGLLLALPLPPGTNAPPAIAVAFLSLGLLEQDGLLMFLGYVLFGLNVVFFSMLPLIGYAAFVEFVKLV